MSARLAYLRLADEFELRRKEDRNSLIFAIVLTSFNIAIVIITHQWWRLIAVAFGALWAACSRWLMHDYERQRDRALVLGIGAVALPLIYIHQKEDQ